MGKIEDQVVSDHTVTRGTKQEEQIEYAQCGGGSMLKNW